MDDAAAPDDAEGGELHLPVDFTMRLDGFETRSVTQRLLYTFRQADGEVVLVDDRDAAGDRRTGWLPDPWDVAHLVVRESGPILGFFDEETAPYATAVMSDLRASQETVLAAVPGWSGRVVAYDISDLTALEGRTPMDLAGDGRGRVPRPGPPGLEQDRGPPVHRQSAPWPTTACSGEFLPASRADPRGAGAAGTTRAPAG